MKAERPEKSKLGTMLLTGAVVIGWAIWRLIRGKPIFSSPDENLSEPSARETHKKESSPLLPSLSKSVPGRAPLDQLARTAYAEENTVDFKSSLSAEISTTSAISAEETIRDSQHDVLAAQSLAGARIPGWNRPTPDRLPVPTFAPATMAMGIVVFAMGIVTAWYVCVVGAMVFAVATWRWVGEMQGE